MNTEYALGVLGVVLLGIAAAMWRRDGGEGGQLAGDFSILLPEFGAVDEPDQTTSAWESALVFMDPANYLPAGVPDDVAARNVGAFLQMIRYAEGTDGENGYRMLFGGGLFDSYADHPRIYVPFRNTSSSAAGAFQILYRTWATLQRRLSLPDFSPASQQAAAVELIRERGALNDVRAGRVAQAVAKVAPVWASLPGAGYNQPERKLSTLVSKFQAAGGQLETFA